MSVSNIRHNFTKRQKFLEHNLEPNFLEFQYKQKKIPKPFKNQDAVSL